ncbi:MAG: thioredoxin-disulfide reductase [Candidatus Woesearchaeota archaeon]
MQDLIIIGGGIAANSAAIYTARAKINTLVISGPELDQLSTTTLVENFPGFPEGVMGPDLVENSKKQAQKFGAKYKSGLVDSFNIKKGYYEIGIGKEKLQAKSIIIATGAAPRKLEIKGEKEYWSKGVSSCAVCDAPIFRDKESIIVGGGDAAIEEAIALSKFAKKVTLIHRRDKLRASKIMQDKLKKLKGLNIIMDTEVIEIIGDGKFVSGIKLKNTKTNKNSELKCQGVFLAIGHIPNTTIFKNKLKLDKIGYIITDKQSKTSLPGIFAAGDCQDPIFKQAATSAGTGVQAALSAEKYIEDK